MQKIPKIKHLQRKMNLITFLINAIGAMATFFYLHIIDPPPLAQKTISTVDSFYVIAFIITLTLTFASGTFLGNHLKKRMNQWYFAIRSGKKEPADFPDSVRRDVLNYPLYSAGITAIMWGISGIIFALLNLSYRILFGIVGVGGLISTVISYLAGELIWRPIIPFFFPDSDLSSVHAFRLPIFGRLLIAFLFIGIMPPALLVNLSWHRAQLLLTAPNPATVLGNLRLLQNFILAFNLIASVGLAMLITRSITDPLNTLRRAMGRVKKNNFETRVSVVTNDELGYLGEHFNEMTAGLRQGEMLRNILNIYVSPEVAQEALEHGTKLGGELIECTVLFSDIRGFTSLSETLPPDELMSLLNRYMSMMVNVIVGKGGMVNKFGGDSLLAVFGTPLNPIEAHAEKAIESAEAMFDALAAFNRDQVSLQASSIHIGIGIATGAVVVGNIGGRERIEYTVIGDTVNLASRLEEKTKEVEGNLLISEETYRQASRSLTLQAKRLPEISVKGKRESVVVYAINL